MEKFDQIFLVIFLNKIISSKNNLYYTFDEFMIGNVHRKCLYLVVKNILDEKETEIFFRYKN